MRLLQRRRQIVDTAGATRSLLRTDGPFHHHHVPKTPFTKTHLDVDELLTHQRRLVTGPVDLEHRGRDPIVMLIRLGNIAVQDLFGN